MATNITPEGLVLDAATEVHLRRCAALRQLVDKGHLSSRINDGDAEDDDDDDDDENANAASSPSRDVVSLVDLDMLERGARHLQRGAGFPPQTLHTFAVKANPSEGVLRAFARLGFGAEVASLGELEAALAAPFPPSQVVFDSPAKTRRELRRALRAGVRVNLDSLAEIERVAGMLEGTAWGRAMLRGTDGAGDGGADGGAGDGAAAPPPPPPLPASFPIIGVRVNPQVGAGSIAALSTSTDDSKFGVPIGAGGERAELVAAFGRHCWLRALHLHVGSQGVPLEAVAEGAARCWSFAGELPHGGQARIVAFDVGGGTPVDFSSDGEAATTAPFSELARLLKERVPGLWGKESPLLITENGRALVAKAGSAAARVEYLKHDDEEEEAEEAEAEAAPRQGRGGGGRRPIAVCHMGADLLMRACYLPQQWSLRVLVVDGEKFTPRETDDGGGSGVGGGSSGWRPRDVAGPLCFQGDRLAVARRMPAARQGDWVVAADAGAYALSMWSHYNSRQSPAVWGYRTAAAAAAGEGAAAAAAAAAGAAGGEGAAAAAGDVGELELELLRSGDTIGDVLAFWAVGRGGQQEGRRRGD